MKIFPLIQAYSAVIGIYELKPGAKKLFNRRNIGFLLLFGFYLTLISAYVLYDANTFQEYAQAIFEWITLSSIMFGLFVTVFRTIGLFQLAEHFEKVLDSRE